MQTTLTVRLTGLCASAVITMALLQSIALLGHPRPGGDSQLARAGSAATQAR